MGRHRILEIGGGGTKTQQRSPDLCLVSHSPASSCSTYALGTRKTLGFERMAVLVNRTQNTLVLCILALSLVKSIGRDGERHDRQSSQWGRGAEAGDDDPSYK